MRNANIVGAALILLSFAITPALGEEQHPPRGFWEGIDVGAGSLQRSSDLYDEDDTHFFLGFKGGYFLSPKFLIGLELSGWLLEASNLWDPTEGEGLSQYLLIARYYPKRDAGWFAKAGGGYVDHWNHRPGETASGTGWGFTFGAGYDFVIGEDYAISPFASYSFGDADDQEHNAVTIGVGFTFQ